MFDKNSYMREYSKKYYQEHKEEMKERARNWRNGNREKDNQIKQKFGKTYYERIRNQFLEMYGGSCECCGETEKAFLCIDHKKGINREHKGEVARIAYSRAIKEYNPDEYRILCANCNQATRYGKQCPHSDKTQESNSSNILQG